jgi:hypothetical protein
VVTFDESVKGGSVDLRICSTLNTLPDRAPRGRPRKEPGVIAEENFAVPGTAKSPTCASKPKVEVSVEIPKQAESWND